MKRDIWEAWEHVWSSGTVQDSEVPDREFEPCYIANVFGSLGKILSLNCFFDLSVIR